MPNQDPTQPTSSVPPVIAPMADLPPLPPDFSAVSGSEPSNQPAPAPINQSTNQPVSPPAGSAAPPDLPPVITSGPKKKFGGGRIIATILGVLLLVGGIGAGLMLTQQGQIFAPKAKFTEIIGTDKNGNPITQEESGSQTVRDEEGGSGVQIGDNSTTVTTTTTSTGNNCTGSGSCTSGGVAGTCTNGACITTNTTCKAGDPGAPGCCADLNEANCSDVVCEAGQAGPRKECKTSGGQHCTLAVGASSGCGGGGEGGTTTTTTTTTAAQCLNVKAYSPTWTLLTNTQLSTSAPGTVINFCVAGSATADTFDKAQFKINSVLKAETTTKRPSTNDYCQSYTTLPTDTTINVQAKIHHTTLGWQGEAI